MCNEPRSWGEMGYELCTMDPFDVECFKDLYGLSNANQSGESPSVSGSSD